jgi:hypothetical protein
MVLMTFVEIAAQREFAPMIVRVWGPVAPVIAKLIVK